MSGDHSGALIDALPLRFAVAGKEHPEGRWRLHVGRAYPRDVVVTGDLCEVGKPNGTPDAEIFASAETWRAMVEGEVSGVEAFAAGELNVRGSIERAMRFETMFEHPAAGALDYSIEKIQVGRIKLSTLIAGDPDGGTVAVDARSRRNQVIVANDHSRTGTPLPGDRPRLPRLRSVVEASGPIRRELPSCFDDRVPRRPRIPGRAPGR